MYRSDPVKRISLVLALVFFSRCAWARAQEEPVLAPSSRTRAEMSITLRERLAERGIEYGIGFTAEYFNRLIGGADLAHGGEYLGSVETWLDMDLGKAFIGRGQVFIGAQNLHGRGINEFWLGAVQNPSSLDEVQFTKLVEAWYADHCFNGKLKLKLGRQYADSDFGVIDNGAEFINSSYGLIPTNPMPTYPSPSLGASAWVAPLSWMAVGAGVYRGGEMESPDAGSSAGRQGLHTLVEVKVRPLPKAWAQAAAIRFGAWQQAGGAWLTAAAEDDAARLARNYGVYATADYWFRKPTDTAPGGPGIFFQLGWAPEDRNEIIGYVGGGMSYRGVIPARVADAIGLGVTRATLAGSIHETVVELFYKVRASSRMSIQPDLQWVHRPSGSKTDALVVGFRARFEF